MYRKGVSALIINKNQEFLLVNLASFKEEFFAIPGGGIEEGENLEGAVYREIQEEVGIEKKSLELIGKSNIPINIIFKLIYKGKKYSGSERNFFGFRFLGNDTEIKLHTGEVRAYKWVPFARLNDYLLFKNQLKETSEKIMEIFPNLIIK
ncbi:MAG: NUDIX domain-containing protein [Candidatus Taylorbacteria bacterium]|nr:NUDIX domain-containing protein [Candidatus Taylorbacteria bacterium]